jgi:glycosyltransferase involved in cell wall biosynthesis
MAHKRSGYLAQPFDSQELASVIRWVLVDPSRRQALGNAARHRAVQLWNPERVLGLYAEMYRQAMEACRLGCAPQPSRR